MSLYPPLTPENFETLNQAVARVWALKELVHCLGLPMATQPGDEDTLLQSVSEFRGQVQKLDLELFRMYGLVHRLKESNVPTTLPPSKPARREPLTTDVLEDLLK